MPVKPGEAQSAYERLAGRRDDFLDRARDCSRLTIPHLLPDEGHSQGRVLPTPYQSVGAQGAKNLASKLLISLFPPSEPFFKFEADLFPLLAASQDPKAVEETEQSLVNVVEAVSREVEALGMRPALYETFLQLVVAGNVTFHLSDEGRSRTYRMDQYVVERDPEGNLLLLMIREDVAAEVLRGMLDQEPPDGAFDDSSRLRVTINADELDVSQEEPVTVYTVIQREGKRFVAWQEWRDGEIPGTRGSWAADRLPYIVLRMNVVSGENYGRGVIEEHLGDLQSLEGLWMSIVQASIEAARVVHMVRPGAVISEQEFARAENGDVLTGEETDVHTHSLEKERDMRVAYEAADRLERRLDQAFLRASTVQRNAERVTAEEVRFLIRELEEALGGAYAALAQELQLPLVNQIMARMRSERRLPEIPKDLVFPVVITGVEALGKGLEFDRMVRWAAAGAQAVGPEVFASLLNPRSYLLKLANHLNLNVHAELKSEEDLAAEQQQVQAMELLTSPAGAQGVKAIGDRVNQVQGELPPPVQ